MQRIARLDHDLLVIDVARASIGAVLRAAHFGGRRVEMKACDAEEPASLCPGGPAARGATMFGRLGRVDAYRSYGIDWCLGSFGREAGHRFDHSPRIFCYPAASQPRIHVAR